MDSALSDSRKRSRPTTCDDRPTQELESAENVSPERARCKRISEALRIRHARTGIDYYARLANVLEEAAKK